VLDKFKAAMKLIKKPKFVKESLRCAMQAYPVSLNPFMTIDASEIPRDGIDALLHIPRPVLFSSANQAVGAYIGTLLSETTARTMPASGAQLGIPENYPVFKTISVCSFSKPVKVICLNGYWTMTNAEYLGEVEQLYSSCSEAPDVIVQQVKSHIRLSLTIISINHNKIKETLSEVT